MDVNWIEQLKVGDEVAIIKNSKGKLVEVARVEQILRLANSIQIRLRGKSFNKNGNQLGVYRSSGHHLEPVNDKYRQEQMKKELLDAIITNMENLSAQELKTILNAMLKNVRKPDARAEEHDFIVLDLDAG